ncbi:MAG: M3 family oligoendopeptidase [Candidatus Marinimicrobia bacterium]|nr:M3 family oligoendopeptidase [Candidatus Neomarinimicrobiota bacterium]
MSVEKIQSTITGAENIRWDLSDLYSGPDDPTIESHIEDSRKLSILFSDLYKNRVIKLSDSELKTAYEELITIFNQMIEASQYANLLLSTSTNDDQAKGLQSKLDVAFSEISNNLVFFDLELGKLPNDKLQEFQSSIDLEKYLYIISRTCDLARYQLSEGEEKAITLKNITGKSAFKNLYGEVSSAFIYEFAINGEIKQYSGDELRALRYHPDTDVRKRAMKTYFKKYEDNKIVFTSVFNSIIKDFNISKNQRGYTSSINVRNTENDLDDSVINTLIDVTTESYSLVQRYYKLKKKLLGLDELTLADIYAPLPEADKQFSWDEAKALVLDAFGSFDSDFYEKAKLMFDKNRIDAPAVKNKRGGAFCSSSTPKRNPFVLLNFTGKVRDVSTLAHELGHAIHSMYSKKQHIFTAHPILPLAETASVFSEMILTDLLLNTYDDDSLKISLLSTKLEDIFSTSHRQNMFTRFEVRVHDRIDKSLLSSTDMCTIYNEELKLMFGDSVIYTDEYQWEWSCIPHMIRVPFYVYSYNFANLLVLSLYQQYLEEKSAFIPKFKEFLSMGSSAKPTDIINLVDQDIHDPQFWQKSIVYIESMIDRLESLIG